jgi:hypothetical protein
MSAAPVSAAANQVATATAGVAYVESCGCQVLSVHCWTHKDRPEILVRDPNPLFAARPDGADWRVETPPGGVTVRATVEGCDITWIARQPTAPTGAPGEHAL